MLGSCITTVSLCTIFWCRGIRLSGTMILFSEMHYFLFHKIGKFIPRKSSVLVLDEATSSVDVKTDQEVQETIRREFVDKGVTVLTVAHRLDTVLGYDKIAVLGDGQVLEYGSPSELLAIPNGELRQLAEADNRSKRKGSMGIQPPSTAPTISTNGGAAVTA